MLPKATACIFCGAAPITEEHIFSRGWLERIWNLPKGHQLPHHHVRGHSERGEEFDIRWSKQEADLIVHCVCDSCNSGWMNTLDRRVYRYVDPMTRGEPTRLRKVREIDTVARWALKVAFMFDYRQDRSTVPTEYARAFHKEGRFPEHCAIWLARNVSLHDGQASGAFHTMGRGDDHPELYLTTFRVDQFVAQVLIGIGTEIRPNRPRHGDAVRQIWPLTFETIEWPPPRTLDEFEYAAFCHAFINDYFRRA